MELRSKGSHNYPDRPDADLDGGALGAGNGGRAGGNCNRRLLAAAPLAGRRTLPCCANPGRWRADPQASDPTVGLVRMFAPDASRLEQRGERPYQLVRKATEAEMATAARTYNLVVSGRIAAMAEGAPVRCWSDSIDRRPVCLIGAEVHTVSFVDPTSGEMLASWRS